MAELEELARVKNVDYKTTIEKASKNLSNKETLLVITTGSKGVILGIYDYKKENLDFILFHKNTIKKLNKSLIFFINKAGI